MKAGLLKTLRVIIKSSCITLITCLEALRQRFWKRDSLRAWVDTNSRIWAKKILDAAQVNFTIYNPHHVHCEKNVPYIIMCNHSSLYDIPLSFFALPGSIRMLAKKEMRKIPVVGKAMLETGFPFIDRHNRTQAIRDLARAKELMESGIIIWLAPEGTRSKTGELMKFKKGGFVLAIETKAQIIPLGICGANKILPAKSLNFNFGQHAEIHIGKPIDASQYTLDQKEQLITQVRHTIQELIGETQGSEPNRNIL